MAPGAPRQCDERHRPEEWIDDRDPVPVIPAPAPWQERTQAVRALPVEVEVARDGGGHADRDPAPRRPRAGVGARPPREDQADEAGQHDRSEEHTSELQSLAYLVCRLLLEKKKKRYKQTPTQITQHTHQR